MRINDGDPTRKASSHITKFHAMVADPQISWDSEKVRAVGNFKQYMVQLPNKIYLVTDNDPSARLLMSMMLKTNTGENKFDTFAISGKFEGANAEVTLINARVVFSFPIPVYNEGPSGFARQLSLIEFDAAQTL